MQSTAYLIVKSLHIVAIISWMAGILYLFRLFVYHSEEKEAVVKERFKIMESRLYHYITLPAMVASVAFGMAMLGFVPAFLSQPWMHAKLLFVAGLIGMTLYGSHQMEALADGTCKTPPRTFRILNEVPTVLMLLIVLCVVLKPLAAI